MSARYLHKSKDSMIAGVCGGVAEYFDVDPTLVRIIAVVLVVVGVGIPIILYIIGVVLMPPDPAIKQGYVDAQAKPKPAPCEMPFAYQPEVASGATPPSPQSPQASPTSSNPQPYQASAGNNIGDNTAANNFQATASQATASQAASANQATKVTGAVTGAVKEHWSGAIVLGALLVGAGILALLANFVHLSLWRFWPVILIVAGLIQLFTPSSKGWSLERAGSAIVLISIGIALLAWMLQIISGNSFLQCFLNLWPVLLVVGGLAIIGSAKNISAFNLAGSLLLSATLILGLWYYSGVRDAVTIVTSDGRNIILSIPNSPTINGHSEDNPILPLLDFIEK